MNIEWSKAPEGFPLWLEGTNEEHRKHSGWYRDAGQVFEGAYGGQWRACREGQFFTVHRNPGPSNWTGEGRPPAGVVCEWHPNQDGWVQVEILGHDGEETWFRRAGQSISETCLRMAFFRPIRTPEQIAAEKYERDAEELADILKIHEVGDPVALAKLVLDCGYSKQAQP